jgi:Cytosine/adenosine deaminases
MMNNDEKFINLALEEAELAYAGGEVPVGAVITLGDDILASAHNSSISMNDPSAHAEIIAIRKAGERIGNYRLVGTTLYVTLEPCIMCAGAIIHARISRVVFGADDPRNGGLISLYSILDDKRLNHSAKVRRGILESECAEILSRFFYEKRIKADMATQVDRLRAEGKTT